MLSLEDYRSVLALDRARHFARAAESLGVTQPSLTARLRRIETHLGARLFERGRGGVSPTEAGLAFLDGARRILALAEDTAAATRAAAGGLGEALSVGFTQHAGHRLVPACLAALRRERTLARVTLHEGPTALLEAAVAERRIDAAFLHPPIHRPELSERVLATSPVTVRDLGPPDGGKGLVRYPRGEAPVVMGTLARLPIEMSGEGGTLAEADSILGALVLSIAGFGRAIVPADYPHPEPAVSRSDPSDTTVAEGLNLSTSLAWRTLDRRALVKAFVDLSTAAVAG